MRRIVCLAELLLGACLLLPLQAQTAADSQGCQNSTVDSQGLATAQKSRAFLAKLQTAVKNEDRAAVAEMVSYPLLVINGPHRLKIKTQAEFLKSYDTIFDAHMQQVIAQQSAKCLFGNYQGVMIGDGQVWFSEQQNGSFKIITVNPSAKSQ